MVKRKPKTCPICSEPYLPYNSLQPVCTKYECIKKYNSEKEIKKRYKAAKVATKVLPSLKQAAKQVFQKWVRLRDAELACVSCGQTEAKWDASHLFSAEHYAGYIFHPDNVHKSCSYCNQHLYGNLLEYRERLVKRIGLDRVKWLEDNKDKYRVYKYAREDYEQIIKTYKKKIEISDFSNEPFNL